MGGAKITRHSAIARDAYIPVYRLMYSYIYMQNIGVVVMDSLGENIVNEMVSMGTQILNDPLLRREYLFI